MTPVTLPDFDLDGHDANLILGSARVVSTMTANWQNARSPGVCKQRRMAVAVRQAKRDRGPNRQTLAAPAKRQRPAGAISREAALIAVNEHCLRHYGTGYSAGEPRRLVLEERVMWIVPAILTSPGYGAVGEVGVVAVEAATGAIVGATPTVEARAAGARLAQEKRHEIDAAFHRARTT